MTNSVSPRERDYAQTNYPILDVMDNSKLEKKRRERMGRLPFDVRSKKSIELKPQDQFKFSETPKGKGACSYGRPGKTSHLQNV